MKEIGSKRAGGEERFGKGCEDGFGGGLGNGSEDGAEDKSEEKFGELFEGMEPEIPPCGLDRKIMARIDKQLNKRSLRRQWFYMLLWPLLGVAAIIGALCLIMRYMDFDIRISMPRVEIAPEAFNIYLIPALCALLLLIADTLIRKRIENKR